jgi:pyruvate kinase
MLRKTKIVATVGPASDTYDKLLALVHAGVNVFRLNFSHGKHEKHAEVIQNIRNINASFPFNIAILADLQGPKLRVGDLENDALILETNDIITFTNVPCLGTKEALYISYPNFHTDVRIGESILIDDGKIETEILEITADGLVRAKVVNGGVLLPRKGVNLPDTQISLPSLTEKDLHDLDFIIAQKIDWIGLSFVRKPNER